ncbi:GPH family glycoside/pentoside/hexuronide:cation symporter [Rhizomicrobium palustre]|uniref:GPH family glycoside/pentoside/hexuronide:cation symporter n=1 Tax=Rhizomicrobium palustre TaxID=189966 RepID=A0A846MZQ2_9PROT|nr:MFS transporter [Rhizomicrobium palustre]NIK88729.1 GPH family glycoside/pentoside/hexuronide:cation symporter [Rhizomicrobium palustre]
MADRKIGVLEKIGYGLGDGASNLIWMIFIYYQVNFYTDVYGLAASAAGTMLLVTRSWDIFVDVIIGMIADRTNTRWGKFRPFLLWMALPFGIVATLAFTTPPFDDHGKLISAYVTLTLLMLAYSAINVPYGALMGVISPDPQERTELSAYRFSFAQGAGFLVAMLAMPLVAALGQGNEQKGYMLTVALFSVLAIAMFIGTFATTRERVVPVKEQKTSTKQDLLDLMKNGHWMLLCTLGILQVFFVALRGSSMIYYFKYYMNDVVFAGPFGWSIHLGGAGGTGPFIVMGTLTSLAATFLIQYVTPYTGRKNAFIGCMVLGAISLVASFWVKPDQLLLLYGFHFLYSIFTGPTAALLWAMFADSADWSEWRTGRRATGLIFSASGMSNKLGWALGGALALALLSIYGYQANMAQTAHAQEGIRLLMAIVPAIGALVCGLGMLFYSLEKQMPKIEADLAARRSKKEA